MRISIRVTLFLMLCLCSTLATWSCRADRQLEALRTLNESSSLEFYYDYQVSEIGGGPKSADLPVPEALVKSLGIDYFASLHSVYISDPSDAQLEAIRSLPSLKILWCYFSSDFEADLGSLGDLPSLRAFSFTPAGSLRDGQLVLSDISFLKGLPNLERLKFRACELNDLMPISDLLQLKHVSLCNSKLPNIESLADCKSLEHVDLRYSNIKDLSPLGKLQNLVEIGPPRGTNEQIEQMKLQNKHLLIVK